MGNQLAAIRFENPQEINLALHVIVLSAANVTSAGSTACSLYYDGTTDDEESPNIKYDLHL